MITGNKKELIFDFCLIILFVVVLQILVLTQNPENPSSSFSVHLIFLILLFASSFTIKSLAGFSLNIIDICVIVLFMLRIVNLITSQIKLAPYYLLPFGIDELIAYFLGRLVFSRRPSIFLGSLFGLSAVIGVTSFFMGMLSSQSQLFIIAKSFLPIAVFIWIIFLFAIRSKGTVGHPERKVLLILFAAMFVILWFSHIRSLVYDKYDSSDKKYDMITNQIEGRLFSEHSLFGIGEGNIKNFYISCKPNPTYKYSGSSSSYLNLLAERGISGMIVFIIAGIFILLFIKNKSKYIDEPKLRMLFYTALFILLFLVLEGVFSPVLSSQYGSILVIALIGFLAGFDASPNESQNLSKKTRIITISTFGVFGFTILVFTILPVIGEFFLSRFSYTDKFLYQSPEKQINIIKFCLPFHPEPYRREAQLLKTKLSKKGENTDFTILLIESAYKKALSKDIHNPMLYLELTRYYLQIPKDYIKARQTLEKAIEACPTEWEIRYLLGKSYEYFSNYQLAIRHYKEALFLNPNFLEAHYIIAKINKKFGNHSLALDEYSYILQKTPDSSSALKAWILERK